MEVLTVAVRSSDGAVRHADKVLDWRRLNQFTGGKPENKWRHLVKQLMKYRRPCRVLLIVRLAQSPCEENGWQPVWEYEEATYRPVRQPSLFDGDVE
jgi:hypothetical protein